ncbi:MAG: hypothetical protein V4613_11065 [Bacteroidota bacterium]
MKLNDLLAKLFNLSTIINEDQKRKGKILIEIILCILFIVSATLLIISLMLPTFNTRYYIIISILWVASFSFIGLIKKGHVRTSAILYISFLLLMIFTSSWTGGGIRAHGIKILPIVVIFSGLTLGKKEVWYFGIVAALGGMFLVLAETNGFLPPRGPIGNSTWLFWLYSATGVIAVCYLANVSIGILQKAIEDSEKELQLRKQSENLLVINNQKLMDIASLQSHIVRKPVANIMGIVQMIDFENKSNPMNFELLKKLEDATNELDNVIHRIVENTEEVKKTL